MSYNLKILITLKLEYQKNTKILDKHFYKYKQKVFIN